MKNFKQYNQKVQECRQDGILFKIKCNWCDQEVLVCKKYKTYCHSKACFDERMKNGDQ